MATTAAGTPYVESADLVANYPGTSLSLANRVDQIMQAPTQNTITATAYTALLLDAGKTVTRSNAAASTHTIPAQATVAWAANTQLNILNLNAGTVTITPAAGVTINGTPLTLATSRGGSLIRTGSNVWTFNSNSSDSGLLPMRPTSIANSGGSASTTLSTTTFTSVTNLSLNGVFTSACDNYLILLDSVNSASSYLGFRLRASGVDNSTANYSYIELQVAAGTTSGAQSLSQTTGRFLFNSTTRGTLTTDFFGPKKTNGTPYISSSNRGSSTPIYNLYSGFHNVSTAYDGISFIPAAGNMTGTVTVYGYAK